MRFLLTLIIFFSINSLLFAQPDVSPQIEKDGKKYYVHTVEQGNTLWGLQQMYHVSSDEITKANPEIAQGLKTGQKILIPIPVQEKKETLTDYTVSRGETLYGISRKFNTTVDHLMELNPELKDGLKKGQVIKVPGKLTTQEKPDDQDVESLPNPFVTDSVQNEVIEESPEITFNDSIVEHEVLSHETMYSISKRYMVSIEKIMEVNHLKSTKLKEGQVLIIPLKRERIDRVPIREVTDDTLITLPTETSFEKKDNYKVAVLLPLFLDYGSGYSEYVSNLSTQFYMGVQMAIDSLEAKGLKADVYVYDTKGDSATVAGILVSKGLADADMIIGPFFDKTQRVVAEFCRKEGVRMVCPVLANTSIIENNPYVYATVPSNITLIKGMAIDLLKNNKSDNILLIKTTKDTDKPLYNAFLKTFKEYPVEGARPKLTETTIDEMKLYIRRGVNTIFVVPTTDGNTAGKFMNSLNRSSFRSKEDNLFVYGTKEWVNLADVNNIYKNKYNFHYSGPNYLDYYTDEMIALNKKHRELFNTDFSRMAVQGYDVMTYFCNDFFLDNKLPDLLMNEFDMKQVSETDGYENNHVFIIEQEEYELFRSDQIKE